MNETDDLTIEAMTFTPSPFPTWPPPSGGYPNTTWELGPITNPFPYGSTQGANISTAPPAPPAGYPIPWGPLPGNAYPQKMATGANGQNQGASNQLPARTKPLEVGPIAASPLLSQISPLPIMGPGPQSLQYEIGPIAGNPPPGRTFPAGAFLDGFGTVITPTRIVGGLGN